MHRFFYTPQNNRILKKEPLYNQLTKILRLKAGEDILCFSEEKENVYTITEISKDSISLSFKYTQDSKYNPSKKINLYQSIITKKDFEQAINFATQAGVGDIYPIITQYSQPHFEYNEKLWSRFNKLIIEAVEQCGRTSIPILYSPKKIIDLNPTGTNLVLHNKDNISYNLQKVKTPINIWIGPEGGFGPQDIDYFTKHSFHSHKLKTPILRSENAGGSMISILLNI